ncbi:MAG TPA: hypothetical protein PKN47_20595 [Nitrospira sp.]|nr:hypothetical protein [Nitrospira sp.]
MMNYQQQPCEPRNFLSEEERKECCKGKKPDPPDRQRNCVEIWKQKLQDARQKMEEAVARRAKAENIHKNAVSWEGKLKKWKEDAEKAHEKAVEVHTELARFLEAVARTKAEETATAVKAVLCLVKSIFDDVNELLKVSTSGEVPKGKIQELRLLIECDDSLAANTKEKALACVSAFQEKMTLVYGVRADLLNRLLEILHSANILVAAVDKPGKRENAGLTWQLTDLYRRIDGETAYTARARKCGCGETQPTPESPCKIEIIDPPEPFLPICKSDYYEGIAKLYMEAEKKLKEAKEEMEKARMKADMEVACYNGLNDAISAAEAAEAAK